MTGESPFLRGTVADTLSAILEQEPRWEALPAKTPAAVRSLLRRCLRKDAHLRLRDIGDARLEIVDAIDEVTSSAPVAPYSRPLATKRTLVALILVAGAVGLLVTGVAIRKLLQSQLSSLGSRTVVSVTPPPGTSLQWAVVSPDGERLALVAADPAGPTHLWVRPFESPTPRKLAGSTGATHPFWSPDGRFVGFFADGMLKRIDAVGGAVDTVCAAPSPRGGTWSRDGTIVFSGGGGLFTVAANGGTPVRLTTLNRSLGENSHRWPSFLPDGRHVLYFNRNAVRPDLTGIYVVSLDTKETRQILRTNSLAIYASPGYLLYRRGENLLAHPFDSNTLRLTGEPVSIADGVWSEPSFTAMANFSVSEGNLLVYRSGGIAKSELLWIDRRGEVLGRVGEPANYLNLYLAPDDRQLAVSRTDEQTENRDVFVYDLSSNRVRQLTFDAASDFSPIWSPHGQRIIFSSDRQGNFDIYQQDSSGRSEARLLLKSAATKLVTDWSADGRLAMFTSLDSETRNIDIWTLRLEGLAASPLRKTEFGEWSGTFSADSRWIAYPSNELGEYEIFVEPAEGSGGRWRVSVAGGFQPIWHPKGKELFFLAPDGKLMAVDILTSDSTPETGPPRALFPTRVNMATVNPPDSLNHYDVSADGQRFLISSQPDAASALVTVVFNWNAPLK